MYQPIPPIRPLWKTTGGITVFESAVMADAAYTHDVFHVLKHEASLDGVRKLLPCFSNPYYATALRRWSSVVAPYLRTALLDELRQWEEVDSRGRWQRLLTQLDVQDEAIDQLAFPEPDAMDIEGAYGFFVGALWADELVMAKLSAAVWKGLRRLGLDSFGGHELSSELGPHPQSLFAVSRARDEHHQTFQELWLAPISARDPAAAHQLWMGLHDRLARLRQLFDHRTATLVNKSAHVPELWLS